MSLLKVEKLNKSFKTIQVLRDVSIEISPGERHVIIGPNGAGKSTLINSLYGTLKFDTGTVKWKGKPIHNTPSYERVHLGMARTFQQNNLFEELTLEENLNLALLADKPYKRKMFKGLTNYSDIIKQREELLEQWEMNERKKVLVKNLSYGEQRVLEIILSLSSNPKLLLLDEPTSGMSPTETLKTTKLIKNISKSIALIVVEHDMEVVFSIADKITVLHHGKVLLTGTPEEVQGNELIQEIYFAGGVRENA